MTTIQSGNTWNSIEFDQLIEIVGTVCNPVPTIMVGKPFAFGIHTASKTYYISTGSTEERDRWIQVVLDGYATYRLKNQAKVT